MKRIVLLVILSLIAVLFLPSASAARSDSDQFLVRMIGDGEVMWIAPYSRDLPSNAFWTDGDRDGYKCFYAFLMNGDRVLGRVTFTRIPAAASYVTIVDSGAVDGSRWYDGTKTDRNDPKELNDCPAPTQSYTPFNGDQRPTVNYTNRRTGAIWETRPYAGIVAGDGVTFRRDSVTPQRVTVVAYLDTLPTVVIYYDSMAPNVVMTADL